MFDAPLIFVYSFEKEKGLPQPCGSVVSAELGIMVSCMMGEFQLSAGRIVMQRDLARYGRRLSSTWFIFGIQERQVSLGTGLKLRRPCKLIGLHGWLNGF